MTDDALDERQARRVFLGIELPGWLCHELVALRMPLEGARWQEVGQLHLTVRFLGKLALPDIAELTQALAGLDAPAFDLAARGAGYFGPRQAPSILWADVEPVEPLLRLRERVDVLLAPLDLSKQGQGSFRPHITLARLSRACASASSCAERLNSLKSASFSVSELCLFDSRQTVSGSEYSVIQRFVLGG